MKNRRFLLVLSFAIIVTLTVCALSLVAGAETYDGKCGDDITWTLNTESGVLTITGSGAMPNEYPMPWYMSTQYIKSVTVCDGVTSVCEYAFEDCTYLTKIALPVSVSSIGTNAFKNTSVTTVVCQCGSFAEQYAEDNSLTAQLIHNYGEWITVDPTTTATGRIYRECSRCHETEEKTIPMLVNTYTDIPNVGWFTESALWCDYKGIMSGTSDGIFSPNSALTRAQFVLIIAKIANADLNSVAYRAIFTDVPDGKWYSKAVVWAYDNGVTSGVGNGKFGTDNRIKRQELAVFLRSFAEKNGKDVSSALNITGYKDFSTVASWAAPALTWALDKGIMKGTTSTTLSPTITATRAQVSVTVKSFCQNVLSK